MILLNYIFKVLIISGWRGKVQFPYVRIYNRFSMSIISCKILITSK